MSPSFVIGSAYSIHTDKVDRERSLAQNHPKRRGLVRHRRSTGAEVVIVSSAFHTREVFRLCILVWVRRVVIVSRDIDEVHIPIVYMFVSFFPSFAIFEGQ